MPTRFLKFRKPDIPSRLQHIGAGTLPLIKKTVLTKRINNPIGDKVGD